MLKVFLSVSSTPGAGPVLDPGDHPGGSAGDHQSRSESTGNTRDQDEPGEGGKENFRHDAGRGGGGGTSLSFAKGQIRTWGTLHDAAYVGSPGAPSHLPQNPSPSFSAVDSYSCFFGFPKVSSRSHTVFTVTVVQRDPFTDETVTGTRRNKAIRAKRHARWRVNAVRNPCVAVGSGVSRKLAGAF